MDRYKEIRVVGRGNYGTAHLVKDVQTGRKLVVKKIPLSALSEKERREAGAEIEFLSKLSHPNVVQYVTSFMEEDTLHIVTSFCNGGDLAQVIKARREAKAYMDEEAILDIFIQLAMAVDYCHSQRVMHRDLKSSNVFITRKNVVKLGDFGIAKVIDDEMNQARTVVGTPFYMSPEVCENKPYDFKSDVWSLGCILYELCALEHPFGASNLLAVVSKIVKEDPSPLPEIYSEDLRNLVSQLLAKDPKDRPSVKTIFKLPFIRARLEALAQASDLPDLDQPEEESTASSGPTSIPFAAGSGHRHRRESSLSALGKSKSMELSKETAASLTQIPPLPKIKRSSSQAGSMTESSTSAAGSLPTANSPGPARRESPPNPAKTRHHHARSRSSILLRSTDEEFASSPIISARDRLNSEDIDRHDELMVLEEFRLRSEGASAEFGSRRTSHSRSNSTIGTVGRISGASAVSSSGTLSRHSRGSSVTALSLDS